MICSHCNTYFCWLCQQILDKRHPYMHFSDNGGTCGAVFDRLPDYDFQ